MAEEPVYYPNGINGETGAPLKPPASAAEIVAQAFSGNLSNQQKRERAVSAVQLKTAEAKLKAAKANLGVEHGVAPDDLSQAGWGVIFPKNADPNIIQALQPLLERRAREAGPLYKFFGPAQKPGAPDTGYSGQSMAEFLTLQKTATFGVVEPKKLPYYLLLVGGPDVIPFSFQYDLDVAYAVGRLHFETPGEYARYAASVLAAEDGKIAVPQKVAFFGPSNPGDKPTQLSSSRLIRPLADIAKEAHPDWNPEAPDPLQCSRELLKTYLGGDATPALLIHASHGVGDFSSLDKQRRYTGALLCQDWPGEGAHCPSLRNCYLAAEDIPDEAQVAGMIALVFACYGAGYPREDTFWQRDSSATGPKQIAERDSVSRLAQRLLAHPNGGALAVMGHIDQAWELSFQEGGGIPALASFTSAIGVLLEGKPIGMASEFFNQKYAGVTQQLCVEYLDAFQNKGRVLNPSLFASLTIASGDARNYVVLGDPAVRLITGKPGSRKVHMSPAQPPVPQPVPEAPAYDAADQWQVPPTATSETLPQSFGVKEDIAEALESIRTTLTSAFDAATKITVKTSTSTDLGKGLAQTTLRAQTTMSLAGDTESIVPVNDGKVDDALWNIHTQALDRAITNRTRILKVILSALGMGNTPSK